MPKEPDTMKLLAITDILITDWSSIYTDYFFTKRPIIFYVSLRTVLAKGNRHKEEQERLLKIAHGNVDGKASERVAKVIIKLVE